MVNPLQNLLIDFKQKIQGRAVYLLAMREHGDLELKQKLLQKFEAEAKQLALSDRLSNLVDEVIEMCQKEHWQSDSRYIEAYVRQAFEKGQGPYKIYQNLQGRTSKRDEVEDALSLDDEIWIELAQSVLDKKYGNHLLPKQRNEQGKRMRFLQSRGFSQTHIYKSFVKSALHEN